MAFSRVPPADAELPVAGRGEEGKEESGYVPRMRPSVVLGSLSLSRLSAQEGREKKGGGKKKLWRCWPSDSSRIPLRFSNPIDPLYARVKGKKREKRNQPLLLTIRREERNCLLVIAELFLCPAKPWDLGKEKGGGEKGLALEPIMGMESRS